MLVFSNPCTGKTESIINLELNGFEVNNREMFNHLKAKDYEWIAECVEQIGQAEPDRILMSMYMDFETMDRIMRRVPNERIIVCGHDVDYMDTIMESVRCRHMLELSRKMGQDPIAKANVISHSWADPRVIEQEFRKFKKYQEIYPDCKFIQLKPGEYLTTVLEEPLKDYMHQRRESIFDMRKRFPLVV